MNVIGIDRFIQKLWDWFCPECKHVNEVDEPEVGLMVICEHCGAEFEISECQ